MPGTGWGLKVRVWVERDGVKVLGPGRVELLEHIDRQRSISAAAKQMAMSYRRAWELVRAMNDAAGTPLNHRVPANPPTDYAGFFPLYERRVNALGSQHSGGANFCLADGSVRFVRDALDATNLRRLCVRHDGEILALD